MRGYVILHVLGDVDVFGFTLGGVVKRKGVVAGSRWQG